MRTALLQPGHTIITFEPRSALSRSAMPPLICLAGFGRVWRLIIITCSTSTLPGLAVHAQHAAGLALVAARRSP